MTTKVNKLQPLDEITINDDDLLNLVGGYVNILTENGTQEVLIASAHQDDYDHLIKYLQEQVRKLLPTRAQPTFFHLFTADKLAILGITIGYSKVLRKKWENLPNNDPTAFRVKVHNDLRVYFPQVINVTSQCSIYTLTGGYTIDSMHITAVKSLAAINNESQISFKYPSEGTRDTITVNIRYQLDLRDIEPTEYAAKINDSIIETLKSSAAKVCVGLTKAFNQET